MSYISHLIVGFVMTYLGLLPPGMMNMTVVNHSIKSGLRPALKFSAGASSIVAVQATIALTFASILTENPGIIQVLKKIAVVVFLVLAVYFFRLAKKPTQIKPKDTGDHYFLKGMALSSMNMLAIPFFFGYSTFMEMEGWLQLENPYIYIFVLGAIGGSLALFISYAHFADFVVKRAGFIARQLNYILSVLFLFLSITTAVQLLL